jgi:hypothetical protein
MDGSQWRATVGSCAVMGNGPTGAIFDAVSILGAVDHGDRPAAFVIEHPGAGGWMKSTNVALGLGGAMGIWRREWRLTGNGSKSSELDVVQSTWRAAILGRAGSGRTTEQWKAASIEHLTAMESAEGSPVKFDPHPPVDGEMGDAFGLAWFAVHSPLLVDMLPKGIIEAASWNDVFACIAAKNAAKHKPEGEA